MAIVSEDLVGQYNPLRSQGPLGEWVREAEQTPWTIARELRSAIRLAIKWRISL